MEYSAFYWLLFNLLSIVVLAFYSMLEMACVSFNKIRLQYYVSKGNKQAIWLNYLLQHPSRLFGTTLIGVNIALVVGSECSREFYSAMGLQPDLAPLTQVILVVIFGELAPMFAARRYPEHVALLGMPLLYASAKLMTPILYVLGWISKIANMVAGGNEDEGNIYLTQEELQKILEQQTDETPGESESAEFSAITANIFTLRGKDVRQVMQPLSLATALQSNATIEQMEHLLAKSGGDFVPLYTREISNIVGIVYPRDALRASENKRVRDYAWSPWFVTETTTMMQILKQFRTNNENVAFILNHEGKSIGLVTLSDVLAEIFGKMSYAFTHETQKHLKKVMLIEKTFSGDLTVGEFNTQYQARLDQDPAITLSELIETRLGRQPEKGDSVYIAPFELTVKEASLREIKTVSISTVNY
ncbi:MAG TPA: hemolysin family protein [Parachlamydiaceae bacterium]|nr:hemolysin family protein [Parachlamydiaceae bacterium]